MKQKILAFVILIVLILNSLGFAYSEQKEYPKNYENGKIVVLVKESGLADLEIMSSIRESSTVNINSIEKLHSYNLMASNKEHGKRLFTLYSFDFLARSFLNVSDSFKCPKPNSTSSKNTL